MGHFLLGKLMISRDGPPFYYISWWLLEVGPLPMYYELMSRDGPPQLMECQLMIRGGPPVDPGLKLQYKTGLKSGWLFYHFTLWTKGGPTSRVNFSWGGPPQLQLLWFQRYHSLAVLGNRGCREKNIQTAISMLLLRLDFISFHGEKTISKLF